MAISKKNTTDKKPVKKTTDIPVVEKPSINTARHVNKNIKISPRKLRLTVNQIKKLTPQEALNRLKFTNTNAARILVKAIKTVIADAQNNFGLNPESLKFDMIKADEGLKIKRMDKSHGSRFNRGVIQKRHSRLIIILSGTISNSK